MNGVKKEHFPYTKTHRCSIQSSFRNMKSNITMCNDDGSIIKVS